MNGYLLHHVSRQEPFRKGYGSQVDRGQRGTGRRSRAGLPSAGSCTWSHAYLFGDMPQINVGQPSPELMEDAARDPAEARELVCIGDGSGSGGGGELDSLEPDIWGVTFSGPDVRAWAWSNVPDQAVAVQFTDQEGTATWQRPVRLVRLVVFPDTIVDDLDAYCPCRFDAIDSETAS